MQSEAYFSNLKNQLRSDEVVLVVRTQQNIVNCFQLFFDSLVNTFGFYIFSQNRRVKKKILSVLGAHHYASLGGGGC